MKTIADGIKVFNIKSDFKKLKFNNSIINKLILICKLIL